MRIFELAAHRQLPLLALSAALFAGAAAYPDDDDDEIPWSEARIYFEFNQTDNDLGVHVVMDGDNWRKMRIENPDERTIFQVKGKGPYHDLGLTELFFEGAEPNLEDVPLDELLARFPEGAYEFEGTTVEQEEMESCGELSHAIPAGPEVEASVSGDQVVIRWDEVTTNPPGFPDRPIEIAGYQVLVESLQVTLPASARQLTLPPEFVATLEGEIEYEVLAIEENGNQTITIDSFEL